MSVNRVRVNYEKYGMSEARYDELAAFVRQYREFKRDNSASARKKAGLIERCAREACTYTSFSGALIRHLADGVSYDALAIPLSRNNFYEMRRDFFVKLNKYKS